MASSPLQEPLLADNSSASNHRQSASSAGLTNSAPREDGHRGGGGVCCEPAVLGPLGSRSWLSALTFSWVGKLLRRGSAQLQLNQEDMFDLPHELQPATCGHLLWRCWLTEQARAGERAVTEGKLRREPSLLRAIIAAYGWPYLLLGALKAAGDALNFAGPMLLNLLLRHLAAPPSSRGGDARPIRILGWQVDTAAPLFGYCCAALLAASLLLKAFLGAHYGYRQSLIASQLRSAVTAAVFRKALAVNAATLAHAGSGRVQTLMSVDADRLVNLCLSFHELWSLPAQIGVALWLLYTQVQYAFLAGLGLVLLLIPVNRWLASRIQAASVEMMTAKDRRVRVMLEVLRGIRAVKCYAWEAPLAARVAAERRRELAALAVRKYLDALCVYFWAATSLLFSIATFGLYALMGRPLTAQVVFTSLALFGVLLGPINSMPWVINGVVEAVVSVRRLSGFLQGPETSAPHPATAGCTSAPPSSAAAAGEADAAIRIVGSYAWEAGSGGSGGHAAAAEAQQAAGRGREGAGAPEGCAALRGLELAVPPGLLVAVTGPVGSGKSSLLAALLGEMLPAGSDSPGTAGAHSVPPALGGCIAPGLTAAFVPQEPWVMHGTLRENVLLGRRYDAVRYQAVLHACALLPDLREMPAGDQTLVGGAGSTLSGGQRARLALARALYQAPDVLVLDDCLASVDARVAAWILRHALLGPMLWGTARGECGEGGAASGEGGRGGADGRLAAVPPEQLEGSWGERGKQRRQAPTVVVTTHHPLLLEAADWVVDMAGGTVATVRVQPGNAAAARQRAAAEACNELRAGDVNDSAAVDGQVAEATAGAAAGADAQAASEQQQAKEERQQGHVRLEVYQRYAAATGWGWATVILLSLLLMQASRNGSDLWLSHWVSQAQPTSPDGSTTAGSLGMALLHPSCSGGAGSAADGRHLSPLTCLPLPRSAVLDGTAAVSSVSGSSSSGRDGNSSGRSSRGTNTLDPSVRFYLAVLLAIAAANSLFTLARAFSFAKGGLVAARYVHEQLLASVLELPLAFFDATPQGRVLNRFSSDTATVDDSLPFILNILLANVASLAGVAAVLCFTQPLVLALLPPLALLYRGLQRYYRATSRELRRLEAVARSPVYTAFAEALSGGPTIRASAAQPQFLAAALAAQAAQQRASVASAAAGSWLALRLQLLAAALAAAVAGAAVAEHAGTLPWAGAGLAAAGVGSVSSIGGGMAAGLVGLSLSYVLPITGLLSGLLTSSAETEQEMVAAERVFQYLDWGGGASGTNSSNTARHATKYGFSAASAAHEKVSRTASKPAAAPGTDLEAATPLLPPPAALSSGGRDGWLHSGHVVFENVWLRYEPWSPGCTAATGLSSSRGGCASTNRSGDGGGPPTANGGSGGGSSASPWVLRGVSLEVAAGSHVGICGRTGAGKSSLLAALLRLTPLAGGRVLVDGRDVAGVVPQQPFVFEGSVAENLDPLGRHPPAELAAALSAAALWHALLAQLPGGADPAMDASVAAAGSDAVAAAQQGSLQPPGDSEQLQRLVLALLLREGAAALSHGQRQLLALARVLLRRPRLLLLDEATSSVDPGTAEAMHEVVRRHLAGCTIIEVAHRQSTIAGCSRVVVMEAGSIVEDRCKRHSTAESS